MPSMNCIVYVFGAFPGTTELIALKTNKTLQIPLKSIETSEVVNEEGEIDEDLRDSRFVTLIEGWEMESTVHK